MNLATLAIIFLGLSSLLFGLILLHNDLTAVYVTDDFIESRILFDSLCPDPFAKPIIGDLRVFHSLRMGWYNDLENDPFLYWNVMNCCYTHSGVVCE